MTDITISPGLILVLSAPSGAGKTTLARRMLDEMPSAQFSISYTTRPPRGKEKDGVDYHFIDTKTFQQKIENSEFVEWAEVHGHFYGSSQSLIEQTREDKSVCVFDIDVQGGTAIKRKFPDAVLIFIVPPSMEELERRLRGRQTETDDAIRRRMLAARAEMERGTQSYDYLIVNDDLDKALNELKSIVVAEHCRRGRADLSALRLQNAETVSNG
ncbi:MAG: guanylate kinase [Myxococcaceae bacterium]|nr:guanylate kinase [Myxococcaceae bacterium]